MRDACSLPGPLAASSQATAAKAGKAALVAAAHSMCHAIIRLPVTTGRPSAPADSGTRRCSGWRARGSPHRNRWGRRPARSSCAPDRARIAFPALRINQRHRPHGRQGALGTLRLSMPRPRPPVPLGIRHAAMSPKKPAHRASETRNVPVAASGRRGAGRARAAHSHRQLMGADQTRSASRRTSFPV